MTDEPLIVSGRDRDMFIVALRSFSDSCEAPRLTPTCPYFEIVNRTPACGEQCHDLLAEYGGSTPRSRTWSLGEGLELVERPRRRRRGPEPSSRPFDAAGIRLHDRDRPTPNRHTVSLIAELDDRLKTPPALADDVEDRSYIIGACINELIRRGFDRAEVKALATQFATVGMMSYLVVNHLIEMAPEEVGAEKIELDPAWSAIREFIIPSNTEVDLARAFKVFVDGRIHGRLLGWYSDQPIDALINWTAPPFEYLTGAAGTPKAPDDRATWIADRFTKTYLSSWAGESLKLEWKYIHSGTRGCAAASQMQLRRIDADLLAKEIAERVGRDVLEGSNQKATSVNIRDFTPIAADFLAAGKHEAAAAIFEGMHRIRPDDGEILNNWGFCLIPLDASKARGVLESSERAYGDSPTVLMLANLTLVYCLLGEAKLAINAIREARTAHRESTTSWLWVMDATKQLKLEAINDYDAYLDSLSVLAQDLTRPANEER